MTWGERERKTQELEAGRLFVTWKRHTQDAQPRKLTFYLMYLEFHRCWVGVVRKEYSMIKRISLLVTAALMAAMMTVAMAAPAFASPGKTQCESGTDAGVWTSEGKGQFYCDRSSTVDGPTTGT